MPRFSQRSKDTLKGVHPRMVQLMEAAIIDSPVDFTVTDGVRSTAKQQGLYAQGRTAAGSIVTNADGVKNKSNHQAKADGFGHAVDICPFKNGGLAWNDTAAFKQLAKHIKDKAATLGISIAWGGDWKTLVDLPHYELK